MSATPNYSLQKPTKVQNANIDTINANMDIIDTQLKNLSDNKAPLSHVGSAQHVPTGGATNNFLVYGGSSGVSIWSLMTDLLHGERGGETQHSVATTSANGFMSSDDKLKLNGVATNANNYVHPANHLPSIITQDANNRFVTDAEKTTWNNKVTSVAGKTGTVILEKGDVGLGGVANYSLASQVEAEEGITDVKYMTALRTKQAIDSQVKNDLLPNFNYAYTTEYTYTNGNISVVDYKISTVLRRKDTITYDGSNNISTINIKVYASDGTTIVKEYTDTITYSVDNITNVARSVIV